MKIKTPMYERVAMLKALFIRWDGKEIPFTRITKDLATELILQNSSVIIKGRVWYFNIQSLGLGIYKVMLNTDVGPTSKTTRLIK